MSATTLGDGETLVVAFALDVPADRLRVLETVLSDDELERAARFRFDRDRRHFAVSRAVLRTVIGRYGERDPARVSFDREPAGKPALRSDSGSDALRVNASRSGGVGVVAIQRGDEVGVDVEAVRPFPAALSIARRLFAPAEYRALRRRPAGDRTAAFFRFWTRKEAVVKALGSGLSQPLDSFELARDPGAAPERVTLRGGDAEVWLLPLADPCAGYVAAVATVGAPRAVRFDWWEVS